MKQFCHTSFSGLRLGKAFPVVLVIAATLCVSSCSKHKAPDFYGAKDDVLREILTSFEEKDYDTVLSKLDRYRCQVGVDKDLLSNLERMVNQNIAVDKANLALDAGDFSKAVEELSAYIESDPKMKETVARIQDYASGREKLETLRKASFSDDILKSANDFSAFLKTRANVFPKSFSDYCNRRILEANKIAAEEQKSAADLLFRDASAALKSGHTDQATAVYTIFSVQNSDDAKSKIEYLTQQGLFDR